MNLDLTGKHALVCGGSQGIGHAAVLLQGFPPAARGGVVLSNWEI